MRRPHAAPAHMRRRAVVGVLFRIVFARGQRSVVQVLPSCEGARYFHARRHVAYAPHSGARIAEPRAPRTRRSSQPNVAYFPRVVVGRQVARSRDPRRVGYPALKIARIRREIRRRAFGHQKIRHGVGELGRIVSPVDYMFYIVAVYQPRVHYEFRVWIQSADSPAERAKIPQRPFGVGWIVELFALADGDAVLPRPKLQADLPWPLPVGGDSVEIARRIRHVPRAPAEFELRVFARHRPGALDYLFDCPVDYGLLLEIELRAERRIRHFIA